MKQLPSIAVLRKRQGKQSGTETEIFNPPILKYFRPVRWKNGRKKRSAVVEPLPFFFFFCDFHMYDIFICRGDDDDDNDSSGEKDANLPYFF